MRCYVLFTKPIYFICFGILLGLSLKANALDYDSADIGAIQNQYQSQLKKPKRKATTKKQQVNSAIDPVLVRRILQPQKPQRIVNKTATRAAQRVVQRTAPKTQYRPPAVQARAARPAMPHADELFKAASFGDLNTVRQLLSKGININIANEEHETALHMAAAKGHYQIVIYLLNHGADINSRTVNNWLPIHHATRFGHANIVNYLLKKGASPYHRTSDGKNALDMARATDDRRIMAILGVK